MFDKALMRKLNSGGGGDKLLTIGIPTYNRALYLKSTIEFFIREVCKNGLQDKVEIVVSNNDSADDTRLIVEEYNKKYRDFFKGVTYGSNVSFGKNLDRIFLNSKGMYVFCCGDDDIYREGIVVLILEIILRDSFDFLYLESYDDKPRGNSIEFEKVKLKYSRKNEFLLKEKPFFISSCVFNKNFFIGSKFCDDVWPHVIKLFNCDLGSIFLTYQDNCVFANREALAWHKDGFIRAKYAISLQIIIQKSNCESAIKALYKEPIEQVFSKKNYNNLNETLKLIEEEPEIFPTILKMVNGGYDLKTFLKLIIDYNVFYILRYPKIYQHSMAKKIVYNFIFYMRRFIKKLKHFKLL